MTTDTHPAWRITTVNARTGTIRIELREYNRPAFVAILADDEARSLIAALTNYLDANEPA